VFYAVSYLAQDVCLNYQNIIINQAQVMRCYVMIVLTY